MSETQETYTITGSVKNPTISLGRLVHCWSADRVQKLLDLIREDKVEEQNETQKAASFALEKYKGIDR